MSSNGTETGMGPAELGRWYYCHGCSTTTQRVAENFTCPSCSSGFVEDITLSHHMNDEEDDDGPDLVQSLDSLLTRLTYGLDRRGTGSTNADNAGPTDSPSDPNQPSADWRDRIPTGFPLSFDAYIDGSDNDDSNVPVAAFLRHLFEGLGGSVPGNGFQMFAPFWRMHGNPGDYAWGQGAFDAIVTRIINETESSGPPPMNDEALDRLKRITASQDVIEKEAQCPICWDDYVVGTKVIQLECEHIFHDECIVPWLKLHGTCPVCRQTFVPVPSKEDTSRSSGGPSLAASQPTSSSAANQRQTDGRRPSNGPDSYSYFDVE